MKSLFFSFFATLSLVGAQVDSSSTLSKAIESGDITTISSFMDETVEICLLNIDDFLDKDEATAAVKNFYSKYSPKSFKIVHEGVSKGKGSQYFIGDLKTSENESFRVFIALDSSGDKDLIQQLRFEIE